MLFLSTHLSNARYNLASYSFTNNTLEILHDTPLGISTHVAVDSDSKMLYWIHYTAETEYTVYKTSYGGQSTIIIRGEGDSTDIDITVGMDSFYILDSSKATITKYDKETHLKVSALSIAQTSGSILLIKGKLAHNGSPSWKA